MNRSDELVSILEFVKGVAKGSKVVFDLHSLSF